MPRYLQEWTCVISVLSKNNFISSIFLPEKTMKQVFVKFRYDDDDDGDDAPLSDFLLLTYSYLCDKITRSV